jgi:hypothetical protein
LTKDVVKSCPKVYQFLEEKYRKFLKNKFEVLDTVDVAFRMLPYVLSLFLSSIFLLFLLLSSPSLPSSSFLTRTQDKRFKGNENVG